MTAAGDEAGTGRSPSRQKAAPSAVRSAAKRSAAGSRAVGRPAAARAAATDATSKARAGKARAGKPAATDSTTGRATGDQPAGLELYVLRHADAGDPARWTGDDSERPLSNKGRRQSKRLGRLLKDLDCRPDMVLTSPKLRASDTARLVARSIGARTATDDRLAGEFGPKELAVLVAGLEPTVHGVMIVGHDPDFSEVVSWLVGCPIEMRKGALARIDLPERAVERGDGSLRWLLPPDAVPG